MVSRLTQEQINKIKQRSQSESVYSASMAEQDRRELLQHIEAITDRSSDAYCRKHFIRYCAELSSGCPYCESKRQEQIAERAHRLIDTLLEVLRSESRFTD